MGLNTPLRANAKMRTDRPLSSRGLKYVTQRSPSRTHRGCYNQLIALGAFPILPAPIRSRGVAQPGRAPGSGPGGRRFKSSLPDHLLQVSVPETWVTERSGDIGYTFGPKGFSRGCKVFSSKSI